MQSCLECYHSLFDSCPAGYSKDNAACLTLSKSIMDMDPKFLRRRVEQMYKEGIIKSANERRARLMYIDCLFGKQEETDE